MPLIPPGGSYDYVSGCPLSTATGSMRGSYKLVDEDGSTFDVVIPSFQLLAHWSRIPPPMRPTATLPPKMVIHPARTVGPAAMSTKGCDEEA